MSKHLLIDGTNFLSVALLGSYGRLRNSPNLDEWIMGATAKTFRGMIRTLEKYFPGREMYFAWEGENGKNWRLEKHPEYKAGRKHNEYLEEAITMAQEIVDEEYHYNISHPLGEADDVIAALSNVLDGSNKVVISRDHDFIQLVQSGQVLGVWDPVKKDYLNIPKEDVILMKALEGDASDNIPGIPGVGPVGAKKLITEGLDSLSEDQVRLLETYKSIIDFNLNPSKTEIERGVRTLLDFYQFNEPV